MLVGDHLLKPAEGVAVIEAIGWGGISEVGLDGLNKKAVS